MKTKHTKLNSHVIHPQISRKFPNEEVHQLTNHDTAPPPPPPPSSGMNLDSSKVAAFTSGFGSVK